MSSNSLKFSDAAGANWRLMHRAKPGYIATQEVADVPVVMIFADSARLDTCPMTHRPVVELRTGMGWTSVILAQDDIHRVKEFLEQGHE